MNHIYEFGRSAVGALAPDRPPTTSTSRTVANHQQEIENLKKQLRRASAAFKQERQEREKAENTVVEQTRSLHQHARELSRLRQDLSNSNASLKLAQNQLEIRTQELKNSNVQLERARNRLELRTQELDGVETFVIKADQHAHSDIKDCLSSLNTEILSLAATIAEAYQFPQRASAKGAASGASSTELTVLVTQITHHEDPTIVQYAMQSIICFYVCSVTWLWCQEKAGNDLLDRLYESLRAKGKLFCPYH
jgi:NADH dehydrogenase/NADH:ubiquinone oxidoreductase subunit G